MIRPSDDLRGWFASLTAKMHGLNRPVRLMEVCGTHTTAVFRSGLPSLLPDGLELRSGPGCPVCVTSQGDVDRALQLVEQRPDVILCTYGDMIRVPGTRGSLETMRAGGADVRVVYSSLDVVDMARRDPVREVVFLSVGFETTAPATAAAVLLARRLGLSNFSVLASHKRVVPALDALAARDDVCLDGLLLPGHVSIVLGTHAYRGFVRRAGLPCVIAGFEDWQIVRALAELLGLLERGEPGLINAYPEAVTEEGNLTAQQLLSRVFQPASVEWRGLGRVPRSGLELRESFAAWDAGRKFHLPRLEGREHPQCICGSVILGSSRPPECRLYGTACTPIHPIGPCMVSSEGTCQAWFRYGGTDQNLRREGIS